MKPASWHIEKVMYTASLATRFRDIDVLLESVREITAYTDPEQPLGPEDEQVLAGVQQQLEVYLTTRERMRLFTPESLRLQIDQHMEGGVGNRARVQLLIVIVVAFLTAAGAACLPGLASIEQRIQAGGATAFSLLTVGVSSLFLTAPLARTARSK